MIREEVEVTALGHFSSGDDATHIAYYPSTNTNITKRKQFASKNMTKAMSPAGLTAHLPRRPGWDFYAEMQRCIPLYCNLVSVVTTPSNTHSKNCL